MKTTDSIHLSDENEAVRSAAHWRMRQDLGLAPAEQAEFAEWLGASPAHATAWLDVNATVQAFARLRSNGQTEELAAELERRRQHRNWRNLWRTATGLAAAAAVVCGLVFFFPQPPAPESAAGSTSPVLIRAERRTLPDGSQVTLNSGAAIAVNYTVARREVRLLKGEAFFNVVKDAAHPFVVFSGEVAVHAVGTAFAVQLSGGAVDVLVTEGKVAVGRTDENPIDGSKSSTPAEPVMLKAGNRLVVAGDLPQDEVLQPRAVDAEEISRRLAWSRPRLQLLDTTLSDAIALLNRENGKTTIMAEPSVAKLRLTGTFQADDARGFVQLLEVNYEVQVEHRADGTLVLRR
ncbi:MAG: FecR domain-containing protein [Opitutaceae bacterium]|nr:FecR domain-containing protein [Opitutaceae bacterium]MBP9912300.1 FecR domain-containing protein [Opitutaceae bacterium]